MIVGDEDVLQLGPDKDIPPASANDTHQYYVLSTDQQRSALGHSTFTVEAGKAPYSRSRLTIATDSGIDGRPYFLIKVHPFNSINSGSTLKFFWLNPKESCDFHFETDDVVKAASVGKMKESQGTTADRGG